MKCPLCGYDDADTKDVYGCSESHPKIYELPVEARRESIYGEGEERATIFACPKCGKLFIETDWPR